MNIKNEQWQSWLSPVLKKLKESIKETEIEKRGNEWEE